MEGIHAEQQFGLTVLHYGRPWFGFPRLQGGNGTECAKVIAFNMKRSYLAGMRESGPCDGDLGTNVPTGMEIPPDTRRMGMVLAER